jgi:hypothetical protein
VSTAAVLQVEMADGSKVPLWCTFSDQQVRFWCV